MIRCVLIDDESNSLEMMEWLLKTYCPQVQIEAMCNAASKGIEAIHKFQPDLVFLDIEMPHMNGFQMLEQLSTVDFEIIFTTSYDQYAIKAFKFSALDYLLKPVDRQELGTAVQKVVQRLSRPVPQQLEILLQKLYQPASSIRKIALPTMEGLQMIPIDSIISCASDSNYTIFQLKNKQKLIVSRLLREVEEMLEEYSFLRVHHSYVVNLNEIEKYYKGDGGYVVMSDGSSIDVSRNKKDVLLTKLRPNRI